MHHFIPLTDDDKNAMLSEIGVSSVTELFDVIPQEIRDRCTIAPFPAQSELELRRYFQNLASKNQAGDRYTSFLGGGSYQHYVPSAVGAILSRGDFFSAYTPYQPEVSQGTLQAIFEFQSMISALIGLPVVNASMYDGGSSAAEAAMMAQRVTKRDGVIVAGNLHPHYRDIVRTYTQWGDTHVTAVDANDSGLITADSVREALTVDTACVMIQSPNFFGLVEDLEPIAEACHSNGTLLVVATTEAMSYGLLKSPGSRGADIFVGEGQSFGLPVGYGGPYLGLFASTKKYVRQMPGRLCGKTVDAQGKPGYVLTLSTREQHIRRAKATSNICTNQGLCALAATVYLSVMGKEGIRSAATQSAQAAHYMRDELAGLEGYEAVFDGEFFNEFVINVPESADVWTKRMVDEGYLAGIPLHRYFPERFSERAVLLCATELHDKAAIDAFVSISAKIGKSTASHS